VTIHRIPARTKGWISNKNFPLRLIEGEGDGFYVVYYVTSKKKN